VILFEFTSDTAVPGTQNAPHPLCKSPSAGVFGSHVDLWSVP
jgi:hypothetical protein